jgi:hypothetical protein
MYLEIAEINLKTLSKLLAKRGQRHVSKQGKLDLKNDVCNGPKLIQSGCLTAPAGGDILNGVTEDDIIGNAITLFFSRTGKSYNQKTL